MRYQTGQRVELSYTDDEYTGLRPGDRGRIDSIANALGSEQIWIRWDDGSTLALIPDAGDRFRVIPDESHEWMATDERILCGNCEAGKLNTAGSMPCPVAP